jgi:hypothetical protein
MMFLLEVLLYTIISRLMGKLFFKQKYLADEEMLVFIVTFVIMTIWLLFLEWIL